MALSKTLFLSAGSFAAAAPLMAVDWSDCHVGQTTITSVKTEPELPTLGKPFAVTIDTTANVGQGSALSVFAKDSWFSMFNVSGHFCSGFEEELPLGMGFLKHVGGQGKCNTGYMAAKNSQVSLAVNLADSLQLVTRGFDLYVAPQSGSGAELACAKLNLRMLEGGVKALPHPMLVPAYYPQAVQSHLLQKSFGSSISFTWDSKCTTGSNAEVDSMTFDGTTLGEPITITGKGTFNKAPVPGTQYSLVMSAMGIPLMSQKGDWCADSTITLPMGMGSIAMQGLGCPGKTGAFETQEKLTLSPRMIFKSCSVQLSAVDPSGEQYFCINIQGSISSPPRGASGEQIYV